MNNTLNVRILATALAGIALVSGNAAAATQGAPSSDVSSRLVYVERLLTESSAAKKVDASGKAEAIDMKAQAQKHFDEAKKLAGDGDNESAEAELREAIRLMTAAARAANGDSKVSQKQSDDYGSRKESVTALATAHDRIATEKGMKDMNQALQAKVAADLAASDELLAQGKGDEARAMLDTTYESIKASLEGLRGGDTLVRELNFETPEDEYHYELDRNDTHRMLVEVLLAEKMQASPMRKTADEFIAKAGDLRKQAEDAAGKMEFEDAIRLLEESTKEFIRAIRSAGVYIPG
jgi:phenylalanyl-tRNA synthetase alpha subunit